MAGKPQRWTPERLGWLAATVAEHVERTGRVDWGETRLREIHTGHLHEAAAIQTIDGVITRTAPSLSAPDAWHAHEGYVGSLRAMEAFYYHAEGAMVGMDVASVRVDR